MRNDSIKEFYYTYRKYYSSFSLTKTEEKKEKINITPPEKKKEKDEEFLKIIKFMNKSYRKYNMNYESTLPKI